MGFRLRLIIIGLLLSLACFCGWFAFARFLETLWLSRVHVAAFRVCLFTYFFFAITKLKCTRVIYYFRRRFESDIAAYRGDDPLDLWRRYVKWVQESYPSGMHHRAYHHRAYHFCCVLLMAMYLRSKNFISATH